MRGKSTTLFWVRALPPRCCVQKIFGLPPDQVGLAVNSRFTKLIFMVSQTMVAMKEIVTHENKASLEPPCH